MRRNARGEANEARAGAFVPPLYFQYLKEVISACTIVSSGAEGSTS